MSRGRTTALAGVVIAAVGTVTLLSGHTDQRTVTAVFDQAHGLVSGNDVWAGGAVVGHVDRVRLGGDGLPHVRMRVDAGYRPRQGATADLRLFSNSGELNRIVVLRAGRGPELPDRATISQERSQQPVELDDVLNSVTPAMRGDVRAVVRQLDGTTDGLEDDFRAALRHSGQALRQSASLLRAADSDGQALRTLITRSAQITHALAADPAALPAATDQLQSLLATTAAHVQDLRAATAALPAGLREPRRALDALTAATPALSDLIDAATPVSRQLQPASRQLARTLHRAAPVLKDTAALARTSPPALRRLGRVLRAAQPLVSTLTPTLRDVLPSLDVLRVYTPELTAFLGAWSSMTSDYDASGNAIRILPTIAGAPNKVISPSTQGPGVLDKPYMRLPGSLVDQPWSDYRSSYLSKDRQP